MSTLKSGTILQGGKYKIVRHISSGGFGNTYESYDVSLDKKVAIKEFFVKDFCMRAADATTVTVSVTAKKPLINHLRKKFVEEARAIAKMEHENIVKVQNLFEENGTAYYVMDHIDGESAGSLLKRRGSLTEKDAVAIILKIASALDYMHKQNRFHLDVKPGNIMLRKDGKVLLIDFGSSKQFAEIDGENTTTLAPCYTPGYAPTEQMNPKPTAFTAATDGYALGATLYKMLTGMTPPSAIDLMSGEENLPPLPDVISKNVKECVAKAMIPQRNKRMQSVEEFVKMLKAQVVNEDTVVDDDVTVIDKGDDLTQVTTKQQIFSKTFTVNGVSFEMMKVEGGTFMMGATSEMKDPYDDEKPTHEVTLNSYYIGQTPVTQALWNAVMGKKMFGLLDNNPSEFKGDNLPVECVSWNDCQEFVTKLNSLTGKCFRLPTEAEWEFAARGGNNSNHTQYSGSNSLDAVAWYCDNSGYNTHPVATKQANELGIYDMSGNVLEWCSDWYGDYSSAAQTDPTGPKSGTLRVFRGGCWYGYAWRCRVSIRSRYAPDCRYCYLGLRLCLSEF